MNVLDLFSGIGGFSLGLERAGMRTVAFCEIEPFCRSVLRKHWPSVPCYEDVRSLTAERLAADGIDAVDVICGGFPCQDISLAGKGAGLAGERSGLWREYARVVSEFRPDYVIVENVSALLSRGLDDVLGDLAALGYDAEWHCIPASAIGAPHRRDRIWIVANPSRERSREEGEFRRDEPPQWSASRSEIVSDPHSPRLSRRDVGAGAKTQRGRIFQGGELERARATLGRQQWDAEPNVGRVAHGIPDRVGQLRGYGNAVVPQIPEIIGLAIMNSMKGAA